MFYWRYLLNDEAANFHHNIVQKNVLLLSRIWWPFIWSLIFKNIYSNEKSNLHKMNKNIKINTCHIV